MKLTIDEKYMFCNEMAMILHSGFSLVQGVEMIYEELDNQNLKVVLPQMVESLNSDTTFSDAILETEAFDDYMANLVNVGESSGNLDEVMHSLSDYYLRMSDITNKLKHALTYPCILMFMMLVVVGIIVFKVLPIFQNVLRSLGSDLSSYANNFMFFGQIFSFISFVIIGIIVAVIVIVYIYSKIKHLNIYNSLIKRSFITKKLSRSLDKAQVTYALSLFMSSGYFLEDAMKLVPGLVDEPELKKDLELCNQELENGEDFIDVIRKHRIYDRMQLNLIQVGFKTGQLDSVMKQLSTTLEDEVSGAIDRFINIIEPTIVALLSLIVGIVLLSVMLPLISIMASL